MRRLFLAITLALATVASGVAAAPAAAADTASISGHVYGEGMPNVAVANASVLVSKVGGGFSSGINTDANGAYSVGGLAAGNYTVRFSTPTQPWVAEAWNNQDQFSGTPIAVSAAQAITGIDALLSAGAMIHGTLTADGGPIDGGRVVVGNSSATWSGYSGSDGSFVVGGLPAGTYVIRFEPVSGDTTHTQEWWSNATTEAAATPVTLAVGDNPQYDADLTVGTTVSGRMQGTNGELFAVNSATVTLVNTTTRATFTALTAGDGSFTVDGVPPGTYAVKFDQSALSSFWATAWLGLHSSFATSSHITVAAGTPLTGVDIVVPRASTISGTVLTDFETSVGGTAVVYEAGLAGDSLDSYVGRGYAGSGTGQYTVNNLLPGSYKLGFSTDTTGYNVTTGALQPSANSQAPWSGRTASYASAPTLTVTEAEAKTGVDGRFTTQRFADVPTPSQFYPQIQWMYVGGISTGSTQPSGLPLYNPSGIVSRQAMAQFLMRLADPQDFEPPASPTFADVPTTSPLYAPIEWMASEGISLGTPQASGKPLYKPSDPVSRQSMAVFLSRFAGATVTTPSTQSFADVPTSASTAGAIQWMATTGISTGTAQPSGLPLFKPADPVSRQAMAAFLYRLAHL